MEKLITCWRKLATRDRKKNKPMGSSNFRIRTGNRKAQNRNLLRHWRWKHLRETWIVRLLLWNYNRLKMTLWMRLMLEHMALMIINHLWKENLQFALLIRQSTVKRTIATKHKRLFTLMSNTMRIIHTSRHKITTKYLISCIKLKSRNECKNGMKEEIKTFTIMSRSKAQHM